jgi:hypothetical protein
MNRFIQVGAIVAVVVAIAGVVWLIGTGDDGPSRSVAAVTTVTAPLPGPVVDRMAGEHLAKGDTTGALDISVEADGGASCDGAYVRPDQKLRVAGAAFKPNAAIHVTALEGNTNRRTILARVRADARGRVSVVVAPPTGDNGLNLLEAEGPDPKGGTRHMVDTVEVVATPPPCSQR